MKDYFWISLSLLLAFGVPVYILITSFVDYVKLSKRNAKWIKENNPGMRLLCMKCKYCKIISYHYRRYNRYFKAYVPVYCRKFRKELRNNPEQRCIARCAEQAQYEEDRN